MTVIYTFEFFSGTDRPVDRIRCDSQFIFNIIKKLKRIICITVHLIDKCKNRNMAHYAYLKQLTCLRLYSFACINHHDCGIRRHKCTVSILREILMSRGIQNIDTVSVIVKLQHRRGDRNTSLLLDLHPVRHRMSCCCLSFYGTGKIDGSSVKQELLRQSRLTCIRMGNDSECTPFFYFFS